ncbi:MAG: fused MFS/spermidine synthase [Blastochloris sp.]|nr:fused MFS/spermidine synthase [Blastochloris sp.]
MFAVFGLLFGLGFLSMGFQLVGTRLLAPYYGSSLMVWAVVISTFLGAFSVGSILGGVLARGLEWGRGKILGVIWVLLTGSLLLTAWAGRWWLGWVESRVEAILPGLILSCLGLFFVPVCSMAALTPLCIESLGRAGEKKPGLSPGLGSGLVYGVNTLGNICGVMLTAFWLIPQLPLSWLLWGWCLSAALLCFGLMRRLT